MEVIANVKYDRGERIGADDGHNSAVYQAYDHYLGKNLVVKEVAKARIGDPKRYFAEAHAVHASSHPRVVPVYWAADREEHVCIAMPIMVGSLADVIKKGALRPSRLIDIAQDLCEGVAQVHIAGYFHLDIKPTNVLLDSSGRAAISDFGLAAKVDWSGTVDVRDLALYPAFRPPEVIRDRGIATHAADVYQIALTLYRAANGERYFRRQWDAEKAKPWPGARDAIADGRFPDRSFLPTVPTGLRQVILKGLDVDPARRPIGARQFAEQLAKVNVKYDWETECYEDDHAVWRLRRDGRSNVVVKQVGAVPSAGVEIYTETTTGLRRKNPKEWSSNIRTPRLLMKALSRAFRVAVI